MGVEFSHDDVVTTGEDVTMDVDGDIIDNCCYEELLGGSFIGEEGVNLW